MPGIGGTSTTASTSSSTANASDSSGKSVSTPAPSHNHYYRDPTELVPNHALYSSLIPIDHAQAAASLFQLALKCFEAIYEEVTFATDREQPEIVPEVLEEVQRTTPEQLATSLVEMATPAQIDYILACNSGKGMTVQLLDGLPRVFAGGDSGPGVFNVLAKPRTIDGFNMFVRMGMENMLKTFTGSVNDRGPHSMSLKAYDLGDYETRLTQPIKGEQALQIYSFGHPGLVLPDHESQKQKPCVAIFSILNFPTTVTGKGPTLLYEECIRQLVHSYSRDVDSLHFQFRAAKGLEHPRNCVGLNTTRAIDKANHALLLEKGPESE